MPFSPNRTIWDLSLGGKLQSWHNLIRLQETICLVRKNRHTVMAGRDLCKGLRFGACERAAAMISLWQRPVCDARTPGNNFCARRVRTNQLHFWSQSSSRLIHRKHWKTWFRLSFERTFSHWPVMAATSEEVHTEEAAESSGGGGFFSRFRKKKDAKKDKEKKEKKSGGAARILFCFRKTRPVRNRKVKGKVKVRFAAGAQ